MLVQQMESRLRSGTQSPDCQTRHHEWDILPKLPGPSLFISHLQGSYQQGHCARNKGAKRAGPCPAGPTTCPHSEAALPPSRPSLLSQLGASASPSKGSPGHTKSTGLRVSETGHGLPAVGPVSTSSRFTCLSLSFLICSMGMKITKGQ